MDKENIDNIHKHFHYSYIKFSVLPAFLGTLLLTSPSLLHYSERWAYSDYLCGSLLICIALLSFISKMIIRLSIWIGLWIIFFSSFPPTPPLIFAHDTWLGMTILALAAIPPSRPEAFEVGPTIPDGGKYNPSNGGKRGAVLLLGFLGWLETRYLTAATLGITSSQPACNRWFCALMITIYTLIMILSLSGGERRWHTRPKVIMLLTGASSCSLCLTLVPVVSQCNYSPCWLCVCLAIESALIFSLVYEEWLATLRYLKQFSCRDRLRILIRGSEFYKESLFWEEKTVQPMLKACKQAFAGVSFSLNFLISICLAITFMKLSGDLSYSNACLTFINIACWLVIVLSTLSFMKSLRHMRWICLLCAAGILLSPAFFHIPLEGKTLMSTVLIGMLLIFLCMFDKATSKD